MAIGTDLETFAAGEAIRSWSFWTAWNTEPHAAGPAAKQQCASESEWSRCSSESSMRGGCAALVEGVWTESDSGEERQAGFLQALNSCRTAI